MISKLRSLKLIDVLRALSVFDVILILLLITVSVVLAAKGGSNRPTKNGETTSTTESPVKIDGITPIAGPAGTELTIIGSGFTESNNIILKGKTIGSGVPSLDGTTIIFVLPADLPCKPPRACAVQIEVSNAKGLSNAYPFKITFEDVIYPLVITTELLANGFINLPYQAEILAEGGVPPYNWSIINGSLPSGLYLNETSGLISGTPTNTGTSTFTVQVNDSDRNIANREFNITISTISAVTIKGRFIDRLSRQPIPNFLIKKTATSLNEDIPPSADENGNFSLTFRLDDLAVGQHKVVWLGSHPCYWYSSSMSVYNVPSTTTLTSGNKGLIISLNTFDLKGDPQQWEITAETMNLGDLEIWPATGLEMSFDREMKVKINYPEDGTAFLSQDYVTDTTGNMSSSHLPYGYPLKVELTDRNGNLFVSPQVTHQQIENTCNPLKGTFANGVFSFE